MSDFMTRLGEAETRDAHRIQVGRRQPVTTSQRMPAAGQLYHQQQQRQVAHTVQRALRESGTVFTSSSMPTAQLPAWTSPERNAVLLGSDVPAQAYTSPQAHRIQRMLKSTGGATHSAFYASETSKFNSSQPMARRGQESSIVFGTPSPEEQARYLDYLVSR